MNTISIYIAGFAALISLIALIWNIANAILAKTAKLRIDFSVVQQMKVDPINGVGNPLPFFDIKITNIGAGIRYIKTPMFVFDRPIEKLKPETKKYTVINMHQPTSYPLELTIGKEHNYSVAIIGFVNRFSGQLKTNDKVRIEVQDTHNKKYYSKKIRSDVVKEAINRAEKSHE